jgi:hypothetical protein
MIVITHLDNKVRRVDPGDKFHLTITDDTGCEIVISEEITVSNIIDFIASYRFALEDGNCAGFHLCGVFANKKSLPVELKNAKMLNELTEKQLNNFKKTVGIRL